MSFVRKPPRFLIADDVAPIAHLVSELVRDAGGDVVGPASNGEEALNLYHQSLPEGVILDIEMPRLTGLDVVRAIRAHESGSACLVIVMTAHADPSFREQALAAGADHFLRKAFDMDRLLQIVPTFVEERLA